jgi:hypothetical protein
MEGPIKVNAGAVDQTIIVRLYDSATGEPATGVTVTDLDIWYIRTQTDNEVTINGPTNIADAGALDAAYVKDTMYEVGKGYYRLDVNDLVFAAGAWSAAIVIEDAASSTILSKQIDIELTGPDDLLVKLLEADSYINTAVTPWRLEIREKGTTTKLLEKELYDVNGANIIDATTPIGKTEEV